MSRDAWFRRLALGTAERVGRPGVFLLAVAIVVVWAVTGPIFRFSDTWQLVINTGTTIVTFLMVFLIQNTQNRDAHAVQLKLDELIRANKNARNALLGVEGMSDEELAHLQAEFARLQTEVATNRERRKRHGKSAALLAAASAGLAPDPSAGLAPDPSAGVAPDTAAGVAPDAQAPARAAAPQGSASGGGPAGAASATGVSPDDAAPDAASGRTSSPPVAGS